MQSKSEILTVNKPFHTVINDFSHGHFSRVKRLKETLHQTKVDKTVSITLEVKTGVPECSSLGPLLFLIYIKDMQNIFQKKELTAFADDTTLIFSNEDQQELYKYTNKKLIELDQYLKANGVQLNYQKSEYMFISARRKRVEMKSGVEYDGKKLKEVEYIKLLGVYIGKKLNFCKHAEYLNNNKLRKFIPIFFKLRNVLPTKYLLMIYYANVLSVLTYCIILQ